MRTERHAIAWRWILGLTALFGRFSESLFALDAETGKLAWKVPADRESGSSVARPPMSPAVADGLVFFSVYPRLFRAVDIQTQETKWTFHAQDQIVSSPAVSDGSVYFGDRNGNIYAVEVETGSQRWYRQCNKFNDHIAPAVVGDTVYVGTSAGMVVLLDVESGEEKSLLYLERGGGTLGAPAVVDGTIYCLHDNRGGGFLAAVDAETGKVRWKFDSSRIPTPPAPAISDGLVFFGAADGKLHAVDASTGKVKWHHQAAGSVAFPVSVADGIVYFGSAKNVLYAVDIKTGALAWSHAAGGSVNTQPVVAAGMVYFGSGDGYLQALH